VADRTLYQELFDHVRRVVDRSSVLMRQSRIVVDASRQSRDRSALVTHCAWCERLRLGEEWADPEDVPGFLRTALGDRRTHGICPSCLAAVQASAPLRRSQAAIHGSRATLDALAAGLDGYTVRRVSDGMVEITLSGATGHAVNELLSRVAQCLDEGKLGPVSIQLADGSYVLGG
jgi:hypothetical protein